VGFKLYNSTVFGNPGSDKELICQVHDEGSAPGAGGNASVAVKYYQDKDEAAAAFSQKREAMESRRAELDFDWVNEIVVSSEGSDRFGFVSYEPRNDDFWYSRGVVLRHGNYLAEYNTSTAVSEAEARRLFTAAETQTVALIDRLANRPAEGATLTVAHYHPFEETIPPQFSGGDLVAVLTQDGDPVPGQKIYFFRDLAAGLNCDPGAFKFVPLRSTTGGESAGGFGSEHEIVGLSNDSLNALTNANGLARVNYLEFGRIDYFKLSAEIVEKGECRIPISAVLFDDLGDPEREPSIVARTDMVLVFKGVARIVSVGTTDERKKPAGEAIVVRDGKDVSVKTPQLIKLDPETSYRGYNLHDGDSIILSIYDIVEIQWLGGSHMVFKPNVWYFERHDMTHAQVQLGAQDAGWGSYIDSWIGYAPFQGALATTGLLAGIYSIKTGSTALSAGGTAAGIPGVVLLGWNATRGAFSPLLLEHKSEILVDFGDDGPTVYTVEGTATLYDPDDGKSIDINTGQMMALSHDGELGAVEAFDQGGLRQELTDLLDSVQEARSEALQAEEPEAASPPAGLGTPGDDDYDSGSNLIGYVIVCCIPALILITGAVLLVVWVRKRRKRKRAAAPGSGKDQPPSPRAEPAPAKAQPPGPQARPASGKAQPPRARQKPAPSMPKPPAPYIPRQPEPRPGPRCRQCGSPLGASDSFCGICGAQAKPDRPQRGHQCRKCGAANEPGRSFCTNCGARLG
jgi:hypothetical protein